MSDIYFPVKVGDTVKISSRHWGNGSSFVEPYKSNGKDHIYTITDIISAYDGFGRCEIELDGYRSGWTNEYLTLTPVVIEEIEAPGDISMLFK